MLIDLQQRRLERRARIVLELIARLTRAPWTPAYESRVSLAMGDLDRAARGLPEEDLLRVVALDLVLAYVRWLVEEPGSARAEAAADVCWQREMRLRNELRFRAQQDPVRPARDRGA